MNIVVLQGKLSREPEERTLPSGDRLVSYEVTTRLPDGTAANAPVSWRDAPATAGRFEAGDDVTVVGHVHRRFFQTGGGTQSRTEVVAREVLSHRQRARVGKAIDRAIDDLSGVSAGG
jgi:single-strand DNA-binding protein